MTTYSRPQPGKDRSDRAAPFGSVGKIGLLDLGRFSNDAILCRIPMAKMRFEVPDALLDRWTCVGTVRARVDPIPRPTSKTLEDPIFLIEPTAERNSDSIAWPWPLIPH